MYLGGNEVGRKLGHEKDDCNYELSGLRFQLCKDYRLVHRLESVK